METGSKIIEAPPARIERASRGLFTQRVGGYFAVVTVVLLMAFMAGIAGCLLAVGGLRQLIPLGRKPGHQDVAVGLVVVDDEDARRTVHVVTRIRSRRIANSE